jgi:hypothetical protein
MSVTVLAHTVSEGRSCRTVQAHSATASPATVCRAMSVTVLAHTIPEGHSCRTWQLHVFSNHLI